MAGRNKLIEQFQVIVGGVPVEVQTEKFLDVGSLCFSDTLTGNNCKKMKNRFE
jgi:hypothetical protein